MSSANKDSFLSFFLIWIPFIFFSYLIALARTSGNMLNKSGESEHPFLIRDLRGPLSMVLVVGLSYTAFIMLKCAPSIPSLLRAFIMSGSCHTIS